MRAGQDVTASSANGRRAVAVDTASASSFRRDPEVPVLRMIKDGYVRAPTDLPTYECGDRSS
ncbi:MAG: hypothetical protein ACRC0L_02560 [Angustibacter sp.]